MSDLLLTIILGTILFIIVSFFLITILLLYQKKRSQYQEEILKTSLEVQEQTLNFVAQEIHDNIGQTLSVGKLYLHSIDLTANLNANEKIGEAIKSITKAIQDLRELSMRLNKDYIANQNLSEVLLFELESLKKAGGFETSFRVTGTEECYGAERHLLILRITQEILNNIIKHAVASCISIFLNYSPECLTIKITDDGKGFVWHSSKIKEYGTGIFNMHSRAKLINADLTIDSQICNGTSIQLKIIKNC